PCAPPLTSRAILPGPLGTTARALSVAGEPSPQPGSMVTAVFQELDLLFPLLELTFQPPIPIGQSQGALLQRGIALLHGSKLLGQERGPSRGLRQSRLLGEDVAEIELASGWGGHWSIPLNGHWRILLSGHLRHWLRRR